MTYEEHIIALNDRVRNLEEQVKQLWDMWRHQININDLIEGQKECLKKNI